MTDVAQEKKRILGKLSQMLVRAPASMATAGIQKTREFTTFHSKATKMIQSGRGALHEVQSMQKQADAFYAP